MSKKKFVCGLMCSLAFMAGIVVAEQVVADEDVKGAIRDQKEARQGDEATQSTEVYRSETILDMKIKNSQDEELGNIEDLVVSLDKGDVRYAALSFGGFLGLGDKLFAVPWKGLQLKHADDEHYFLFDISKEKLEEAPGFEKESWPNFADPKLAQAIDTYYRAEDREKPETERKSAQKSQRSAETPQREGSRYGTAVRLSKVSDMAVRDAEGRELGKIVDVAIDVPQGKVQYAALDLEEAGFSGDKLYAMPWGQLKLQKQEDNYFFALDVSREKLKQAEGFDKEHWPDFADKAWQSEVDKFYLKVEVDKKERAKADQP